MARTGEKKPVSARIVGTGHYLPSRVLTNAELEQKVETSDAWILERTGIRERRIADPSESTSDMAAAAARRALESAEVDPKDVDLILVATISADAPLPSAAVLVQQKVGARTDCPAMDLAAACAGFLYGLSIAEKFIRAGEARYVLVVGVELLSRVIDWSDRSTCVLFGDGAGAVVVGPSTDGHRGILSTHLFANGTLAPALTIPAGGSAMPASHDTIDKRMHFVHMDGQEIFKFAVKALSSASTHALRASGFSPDDIDWVVPHQANKRILGVVSQRCGIPLERFFLNIERCGNTSSASIPIALDEAVRGGFVQPGHHLLFCALGAGIAWGSAVVRW